jgi:hypothetical protein
MNLKSAAFDDPVISHVMLYELEYAVAQLENKDTWVGNRQLNLQTPKT